MMDESGITSQCWSVLEAVPNEHFVWTTALGPGHTPNPEPEGGFHCTDILEFSPASSAGSTSGGSTSGTLYRVEGRHATQASADQHAAMGFEVGRGLSLD
jgi:hypothetical protein